MKRFPLVVAALVLSLLGSCTPASKLPQFARDDYFYSELEIPGFPFNFVYLNFVRNFDDGTADGDITLHRADANVTDGGNLYSREVGGQLELTFDVTLAFDSDNPLGADLVAATLLVSVRSESLDGNRSKRILDGVHGSQAP